MLDVRLGVRPETPVPQGFIVLPYTYFNFLRNLYTVFFKFAFLQSINVKMQNF